MEKLTPSDATTVSATRAKSKRRAGQRMLVTENEIAKHRAIVQQFKQKVTLAKKQKSLHNTSASNDEDEMDQIAEVEANALTSDQTMSLKATLGTGMASTALVLINGGTPAQIGAASSEAAINFLGAGLTIAGLPMLGIAATMAATMIRGVFGKAQSSPLTALWNAMQALVETAIKQNNIQVKMADVQDLVLSLAEELLWTPDLLAAGNEDVETSYLLTVQHDLATNARLVFGDCYDNPDSDDCKAWQEAGTVFPAVEFAQLHVAVFTSLAQMSHMTASPTWMTLVKNQMLAVGERYYDLLSASYEAYKTHRLAMITYFWVGRSCGYLSSNSRDMYVDDTGADGDYRGYYRWTQHSSCMTGSYFEASADYSAVMAQYDARTGLVGGQLQSEVKDVFENLLAFATTTTTTTTTTTAAPVVVVSSRRRRRKSWR